MNLYKLAGAILLTVSGALGAHWLNRSATEALRQTEGVLQLLRFVRTQVECFSLPIPQILARCDRALLRRCGYDRSIAPNTWEELLDACREWDGVSIKLMREFAEAFGQGYREEQCQSCDYFLARIEARRAELQAQLADRKKRNTALCLSGALAAVIVFL